MMGLGAGGVAIWDELIVGRMIGSKESMNSPAIISLRSDRLRDRE